MLKLIPHIADGSWLIKQSVGTTPVIMGKALKTTYHVTPQVRACVYMFACACVCVQPSRPLTTFATGACVCVQVCVVCVCVCAALKTTYHVTPQVRACVCVFGCVCVHACMLASAVLF